MHSHYTIAQTKTKTKGSHKKNGCFTERVDPPSPPYGQPDRKISVFLRLPWDICTGYDIKCICPTQTNTNFQTRIKRRKTKMWCKARLTALIEVATEVGLNESPYSRWVNLFQYKNVASPVLSFSLSFSQRNEVSSPIVSLFLLSTISLSLSSRRRTAQ